MSTENITELCIPRETVNDDTVTLLQWRAADGEIVSAGQTVAIVETSKSVLDLPAPADGILRHLVLANSEVEIGAPIGTVSEGGGKATADRRPAMPAASNVASNGERLVSASAQRLIDEHQIGLDRFNSSGMIRSCDVIQLLNENNDVDSEARL